MVKTGLIKGALLTAGLIASIQFTPPAGDEGSLEDESEQWQRFSERCSSDSLRTLSQAEADFRANDRDWNQVNDFWTADIKGLYTIAEGPDPCDSHGKSNETCASARVALEDEGWTPQGN